MSKATLWLLLAELDNPEVALVAPTLAWAAEGHGAALECYLEAQRGGGLFAPTGSTVLGGKHHEQFNYLCAAFDVRALLLGDPRVFNSSLPVFDIPVLARAERASDLYRALDEQGLLPQPAAAVFAPDSLRAGDEQLRIGAYLFPEIYFRRALGFLPGDAAAADLLSHLGVQDVYGLYRDPASRPILPNLVEIDDIQPGDGYGTLTLRIAERWKGHAQGVAFGDPPAILSQVAAHCRERRVAVFAPRAPLPTAQVKYSAYSEQISGIAAEVTRLANEVGNPVITGRQTGDGDLFEWAKGGVCMQIIDPNRPPFPMVETVQHRWDTPSRSLFDQEPADDQLRHWAHEGKVLATLLFHSGEVAHNEAMLSLLDLASYTGVKLGIGVHHQRYETCPQLWEMLNVPVERGGVQGLIEPVLYSGGRGIMAECNCPAESLHEHCMIALERIRSLAGPGATPRGYQAFMDSDLCDLMHVRPELFEAIGDAGLEYAVTCAMPGRNRIVWRRPGFLAINQSTRAVRGASNFLCIGSLHEYQAFSGHTRPGWMISTLDSIYFFGPHLWEHGPELRKIVSFLLETPWVVNATPHTIARYARVLSDEGYLPTSDPMTVRHAIL